MFSAVRNPNSALEKFNNPEVKSNTLFECFSTFRAPSPGQKTNLESVVPVKKVSTDTFILRMFDAKTTMGALKLVQQDYILPKCWYQI